MRTATLVSPAPSSDETRRFRRRHRLIRQLAWGIGFGLLTSGIVGAVIYFGYR